MAKRKSKSGKFELPRLTGRRVMYEDGSFHSGGNTTRGANRVGYRGGRKPIYPKGTQMVRFVVTAPDELAAVAAYLGAGSAAAGVRKLLETVRPLLAGPVPSSWLMGLGQIKASKAHCRQDAAQALARVRALAPLDVYAKPQAAAAPTAREAVAADLDTSWMD